ncbi:hypothetical protein T484DRAFT_1799185 [Baffinella frigidus]|nr:hypothetical protein T484DRAFT_1799185 [Cryptophyta sp. CCMP2293]
MCGKNGIQTLKAAANSGASWLASNESADKKPTSRVIFPRRKGGENYHSAGPVTVTRQDLDSLTHLPLPIACKKLGLSATTFKKACRREGLMVWPFRRGAQRGEDRAQKIMHAIMIPEPSVASTSSQSEGDSTSPSSPDGSSEAAPQSPCSSTTTTEEPTSTEEDAGACAAPGMDFLEPDFFGSDHPLLPHLQDPYLQEAMFNEEDSAILRMTGWDAHMGKTVQLPNNVQAHM